jgi:thioredoxin reductase
MAAAKAGPHRKRWDVVIVGGGPAGLSAGLVLGRSCRAVLICDTGTPRSWASKAQHGFLTRDGIPPDQFRRFGRVELRRYRGVQFVRAEVVSARRALGGFRLRTDDGVSISCRKLLIATGVFDRLPPIPGVAAYFGNSVFQCPYCDGWEFRDTPVAVYGRGRRGYEMSRALTAWTRDIVLCTDGPARLTAEQRQALKENDIRIREERITGLAGSDGKMRAIEFKGGAMLARRALFFDTPVVEQSRLARSIGCEFDKRGGVKCGRYESTSVPGVFVAGNIIKDVQLAIVAAAEGAKAAFGINKALTREDFDRPVMRGGRRKDRARRRAAGDRKAPASPRPSR